MAVGNEDITKLNFSWRLSRVFMRRGAMKLLRDVSKLKPNERGSISDFLERNVRLSPNAVAVRYEDQVITWREFNARANQYAHYFKSRGIQAGDKVAINVQNRPEILIAIMGGLKLGAIMAMINTTQTGNVLAHSLSLATPKLVVVGAESVPNMATIQDQLDTEYADKLLFIADKDEPVPAGYQDAATELEDQPVENLPETRKLTLDMPAYYIFTSGTTGMPKASVTTHYKLFRSGMYMGQLTLSMTRRDTFYCSLPFYHSNALVLSWSSVLTSRGTIAIGRKFSASRFWDECRQHNATVFCYIGELLRYLLNQPEKPNDRDHSVVKILGNGLRPDIWDQFKERFGVERIHEFYGSSEGNIGFVNLLNYDKTCGWAPGFGKDWNVIAYDIDGDEPVVENGQYRALEPGETGLLVMKVTEQNPFDGYTDPSATETKLFRGVFEPDDVWFNTGDLIALLPCGHTQFVDRVGDTFRWNGENVATTEVEASVINWPQTEDAVVYGVQVKGSDGRCGMLSLTPKLGSDLDLDDLARHMRQELPPYAVPRFLRIQQAAAEVTGTFKHKKSGLKAEGFDPEKINEPLYVLTPGSSGWEPLTPELKTQIESGQVRL
ncbi:MAG: long-chain-acyl-CoA synthetase [Pseudomonadota bacterium]